MANVYKPLYEDEDVQIDGDLSSDITVKDGALTVNGNVAANVKITMSSSSDQGSSIGVMSISGRGGCSVRIGGSRIQAASMSQIGARTIYEGGVNINGKIITNGCVVAIGDKYTITHARDNESRSVAAIVNGTAYNGSKIVVQGSEVAVYGAPGEAPVLNVSGGSEVPSKRRAERLERRLSIKGTVADGVTINCDYPIVIDGEIGAHVTITGGNTVTCVSAADTHFIVSAHDRLVLNAVGSDSQLCSDRDAITVGVCGSRTTLTARDKITANGLAKACVVHSKLDGFTCVLMADDVQVNARDSIRVDTVADRCRLISNTDAIMCGTVGAGCHLQARDKIKIEHTVGERSNLTSRTDRCEFGRLANEVVINARDNIVGRVVGQNCQLTSSMEGVHLDSAGPGTHITVRANAVINTCGDNVHVSSSMEGVRIGITGSSCHITARENATINELGANSHVNSSMGSIAVTSCGANCHLTARESVRVTPATGVRADSIHANGRTVIKN